MTFFRTLLLTLLIFGATTGALADDTGPSENAIKFDVNVRRLDILNQLLPVLLTKKQINELLPTLEKARANVRQVRADEDKLVQKLSVDLEKAIKAGVETQKIPTLKELATLNNVYRTFDITRGMTAYKNVDMVLEAFKKIANKGQLKVAAQSLNPRFFDNTADPSKMTDEQKIKVFIREIILDPLTYDLLVKIAKNQKE